MSSLLRPPSREYTQACMRADSRSCSARGGHSIEGLKADLTVERPSYALTCYGAAKGDPNLISDVDESPEELRLRFYQARAQNDPSLYVSSLLTCSASLSRRLSIASCTSGLTIDSNNPARSRVDRKG